MLLLEPLGCTAEEIIQGARDFAAVQRYLDCLEQGWLGQALIERYTYGQSPETPAGMLQTNSIRDGILFEWLKPIEDEIKDDLHELLHGGHDEMIVIERDTYAKAMENTEDPGRELLGQLVDMIDEGLSWYCAQSDLLDSEDSLTQRQSMPKIYATVKSSQELGVAPSVELKWCNVLEEAITRLSEKVLEESVVAMNVQKSGLDFRITYQLTDAEDASSALALVQDLKDSC